MNNNIWDIKDKTLLILIVLWAILSNSIFIPIILMFIILGPKIIKLRIDFSIRWTEWVHVIFILLTMLMSGLFYLNKQKTNFFEDASVWLPLISSVYLFEYYWSTGKPYVWSRKIKKNKIKKPEYLLSRINNFNKYYISTFNDEPSVYPKAIYLIFINISILGTLNTYNNISIYYVIVAIIAIFFTFLNIKRIFIKRTKKELFLQFFIISIVSILCIFSYNSIIDSLQNYQKKHSWSFGGATWFNPEFDHSSIGETGNFVENEDLLFRIIWNEKPGTLLPAAYYDMTMDGANWQILLGGNQNLVNNNGSRIIPDPNTVPLIYNKLKNENYWEDQILNIKTTLPLNEEINNTKIKDNKNAIIVGTPLRYRNGRTFLPLPKNTHTLLGGDSADMSMSSGGNILFTGLVGEVNLQALYNDNPNIPLHAPNSMNLTVPKNIDPVLKEVIKEIGLSPKYPVEVNVKKLKDWYLKNFKYTLNLTENGKPRTLSDFLLSSRRGHCEYFATTSALILRELGIPTKYVVGFYVSEAHPSEDTGMFWVRAKDKHAWTAYWNGKSWKNINMTVPMEDNNIDFFQSISDSFNTIQYKISNIDISTYMNDSKIKNKIIIVLLFLVVMILLLIRKKWKKIVVNDDKNLNIDSKEVEFLLKIKEYLEEYPRKENEPLGIWVERTKNRQLKKEVENFYKERYKKV